MVLHIISMTCHLCRDCISTSQAAPAKFLHYDLTDRDFGRLHVQHFFGMRAKESLWCCLCVCMTPRIVMGRNLRNGITQSCGCLHGEIMTKPLLADGTTKECSQCQKVKSLDEFHAQKGGSQGKAAACKDCVNRRCAIYAKTHLAVTRTHNARRRARKNGAEVNNLTPAQWEEIQVAYDYRCVYCGRKMKRLTQDHITPLSKGGNHTVQNVVPACYACNYKKRTGPPLVPIQPLLLTMAHARAYRKRSTTVLPR